MKRYCLILFCTLLCQNTFAQNFWAPVTGLKGGYITATAINSNGDLYVGTAHSGVFCSTDKGNSWTNITKGLNANDGIKFILITPSNTIFISVDNDYASSRSILFKTSDNGNNWVKVMDLDNYSEYSRMIYAGTDNLMLVSSNGTMQSLDNGESFKDLNCDGVFDIAISNSKSIFACQGGQIIRSMDNGKNWDIVYKIPSGGPFTLTRLFVSSKNEIYCSFVSGHSVMGGILRSTDNGLSWNEVYRTEIWDNINDNYSFTESKDKTIYVAGSLSGRILQTIDGKNWTEIYKVKDYGITSMIIDQEDNLYIGTYANGILRSRDKGKTWVSLNLSNIYAKSIHINNAGHLFIGTPHIGWYNNYYGVLFRSTDNGNSCTIIYQEKNKDISQITSYITNFLYLVSTDVDWGDAYFSTDNGDNWKNLGVPSKKVSTIAINKKGEICVGTFGEGAYLSTNNGNSWKKIFDSNLNINSIFMGLDDNIFLIFQEYPVLTGAIFNSINNGVSWKNIYFDSLFTELNGFYWGLGMPKTICINSKKYLYTNNRYYGNILYSKNNGNTWEAILVPSIKNITSLFIDKNDFLYVTGGDDLINYYDDDFLVNYGVYLSSNNGYSWNEVNSGLTTKNIRNLCLDQNGYIYAGSWGYGVSKSVKPTTGIPQKEFEVRRDYYLLPNFPNPFNPSTNIKYSIPKESYVVLKIFDALGREVKVLVDKKQPVGEYEVNLSASDLTSGIYFYRLNAGEFHQVKKMTLLR